MENMYGIKNKYYGNESIYFIKADTEKEAIKSYLYTRYEANYINSLTEEALNEKISHIMSDYDITQLDFSFDEYGVCKTSIYLDDNNKMQIF